MIIINNSSSLITSIVILISNIIATYYSIRIASGNIYDSHKYFKYMHSIMVITTVSFMIFFKYATSYTDISSGNNIFYLKNIINFNYKINFAFFISGILLIIWNIFCIYKNKLNADKILTKYGILTTLLFVPSYVGFLFVVCSLDIIFLYF